MSVTGTLVMQGNQRGDSARKQPFHLPIIAPKDDHSSSAGSNRSVPIGSGSNVPPRTRLPPRSRTGCWTCRTRKVKCDEGRPLCGQCTRLGHTCDYSARLTFREDTKRIQERMAREVVMDGSPVWDPMSPISAEDSPGSDELGAFASLTTDEDRERKAELATPGTYHVVVNPCSFQHLPEYSDDPEIRALSPLRRGSIAVSLASSVGKDSITTVPGDSNIVVLRQFEDTNRRAVKDSRSMSSPTLTRMKIEDEEITIKPDPDKSLMHKAMEGGPDAKYLHQFRTVVWKQLVQAELATTETNMMTPCSADVLEHVANYFPPLFHAMMAIAAFSLAQTDGKARVDALERYDLSTSALQANLRSAQDLSSDGAFLTHFVLLVYEIAAVESGHEDMWSQHFSTLLQISKLRREIYHGERYPFVTWWICNIDMYALFSGAGGGEFVGAMLRDEMIPPPGFHLYPLGPDGSSVVYADEIHTLPTVLQLNYEITVLAVRLALLAQELRQEVSLLNLADGLISDSRRRYDAKFRHARVFDLQESLRAVWLAEHVALLGQQVDSLPYRAKVLFEHASALYRACIIYSHTSMWVGQRMDMGPESDGEIAQCVSEILTTAQRVLEEKGGREKRFIVFPLFMAGIGSQDGGQKMVAMDLIGRMEAGSLGWNTRNVRRGLGVVYERQTRRFMVSGTDRDVEWMRVVDEQGLGVVSFGL